MTKKKVRKDPAPEYVGAPFLEPSEAKGVPEGHGLKEKLAAEEKEISTYIPETLPELDEYKIRDMFPVDPLCKEKHVFPMMKLDVHFREMGEQLFYSCPHNEHLQRALLSLRQAQLGCHRAIMSEENI